MIITVKTNMEDAFVCMAAPTGTFDQNMMAIVDQRMQAAGAPANWTTCGLHTRNDNIATRESTFIWSDDAHA